MWVAIVSKIRSNVDAHIIPKKESACNDVGQKSPDIGKVSFE